MLLNVNTACCQNYLHQSPGPQREKGPGRWHLAASGTGIRRWLRLTRCTIFLFYCGGKKAECKISAKGLLQLSPFSHLCFPLPHPPPPSILNPSLSLFCIFNCIRFKIDFRDSCVRFHFKSLTQETGYFCDCDGVECDSLDPLLWGTVLRVHPTGKPQSHPAIDFAFSR